MTWTSTNTCYGIECLLFTTPDDPRCSTHITTRPPARAALVTARAVSPADEPQSLKGESSLTLLVQVKDRPLGHSVRLILRPLEIRGRVQRDVSVEEREIREGVDAVFRLPAVPGAQTAEPALAFAAQSDAVVLARVRLVVPVVVRRLDDHDQFRRAFHLLHRALEGRAGDLRARRAAEKSDEWRDTGAGARDAQRRVGRDRARVGRRARVQLVPRRDRNAVHGTLRVVGQGESIVPKRGRIIMTGNDRAAVFFVNAFGAAEDVALVEHLV